MKRAVLIIIFSFLIIVADSCFATRESNLNRRKFRPKYGMEGRNHELVVIKRKHDRFNNQKIIVIHKKRKHHSHRDF